MNGRLSILLFTSSFILITCKPKVEQDSKVAGLDSKTRFDVKIDLANPTCLKFSREKAPTFNCGTVNLDQCVLYPGQGIEVANLYRTKKDKNNFQQYFFFEKFIGIKNENSILTKVMSLRSTSGVRLSLGGTDNDGLLSDEVVERAKRLRDQELNQEGRSVPGLNERRSSGDQEPKKTEQENQQQEIDRLKTIIAANKNLPCEWKFINKKLQEGKAGWIWADHFEPSVASATQWASSPAAVPVVSVASTASQKPSVRRWLQGKVSSIWQVVKDAFISSRFGRRWGKFHSGIDLVPLTGSRNVSAVGAGLLEWGFQEGGAGQYAIIHHNPPIGNGIVATLYFHLKSKRIAGGNYVRAKDIIATMGGDRGMWYSGNSTGVHLHLETHQVLWSQRVDPMRSGIFESRLSRVNLNHPYVALVSSELSETSGSQNIEAAFGPKILRAMGVPKHAIANLPQLDFNSQSTALGLAGSSKSPTSFLASEGEVVELAPMHGPIPEP